MIKRLTVAAAVVTLAVAGCSSSSDSSSSASPTEPTQSATTSAPTESPTSASPSGSSTIAGCDLDTLNKEVFPADEGASSIECVKVGDTTYAYGETGPTAAGVTGVYLAELNPETGWVAVDDDCSDVPSELQKYCTGK